MTKNEYLIALAAKLQKLTDDPRGIYPELRSMIEFYQEMIDDKIEDGMAEEEAVAAMETPDEIFERVTREFGEMATEEAASRADECAAEAENAEMRQEYDPESLKKIIIEDLNCGIIIRPGAAVAINYCNGREGAYHVSQMGGTLSVKFKSNMRSFLGIFRFRKKRPDFVLEIPKGWKGALQAITENAKIELETEISDISLRTSNAKIGIRSTVADSLRAVTSNGKIHVERVDSRYAEFITGNAKIDVNDIKADELKLVTGNGSVNATNIAATVFSAKTSNGTICVQDIISDDIMLKSSNGAIVGEICGEMSDYAIASRTSNGKNNLPDGTSGARKLDVHTSNANIAIEFVKKFNAEE